MNNTSKNKKIITLSMILLLIIAGICIMITKGINYNIKWKDSILLEVYIDNEVENSDIKTIAKEVFKDKEVKIQNIAKSKNQLIITVDSKEISDEELNSLIEKINERYEENLDVNDIEKTDNYQVNLIDVIKPYIPTVIVTLIISIAYFIIRYQTMGIDKLIGYLVKGILITQLVYFSVVIITRVPVGVWTIPLSIVIYVISIILLSFIFDREYKKVKPKKNKK